MMNRRQPQKTFNLQRVLKKLSLSAFVVFSFILYAAQKPFAGTDALASNASPTPGVEQQVQQLFTPTSPTATLIPSSSPDQALAPTQPEPATATAVPQLALVPTKPLPTATSAASTGLYKDGTYKGPEVNAFYGLVQVQAVVQNGKIKTVQFLEYPADRRTSQRINSYAVPTLQQEAVQVQNANVNIISGATLTSQAFIMSLQSALANAHS